MASPSPAGSPAADFLTPRTKLAKELEAIDNAPTPTPKRKQSPVNEAQRSAKSTTINPFLEDSDDESLAQLPHASSRLASGTDASSGDDSVKDMRRPRGGAARRMLAAQDNGSPPARQSLGVKSITYRDQNTSLNGEHDDLYDVTPVRKRISRRPMASSPPASARSVGLFVSPAKNTQDDSDGDLPAPIGGSRLADLVAKNREKRLTKEAEEKARKERAASAHASADAPDNEIESSQHAPDENVERIMSDAVKPARKASKKALLEMERETQRMSRQMALAHQMKVKRKFTMGDFAKRFQKPAEQQKESGPDNTTSSSAPNSDGPEPAAKEPVSTPPSSPPTPLDRQRALVEHGALSKMKPVREETLTSLKSMIDEDEEPPDLAQILNSPRKKKVEAEEAPQPQLEEKKGLKLARLGKNSSKPVQLDDSDDDNLEIIQPMPRHLRAFDNIRPSSTTFNEGSKAIQNLKHLSHIGAYVSKLAKKGTKPSIGAPALEAQLRRKAKGQARKQQQERLEELKAKGIVVQTAEERERAQEEYEDLLEKARREATDLRKAEKAAAKEAGVEGADAAASSDDDEYEDELGSGSEEETMGDGGAGDGLVDDLAEEDEEEEKDDAANDEDTEGAASVNENCDYTIKDASEDMELDNASQTTPAPRKTRNTCVVKDDDDESDFEVEDERVEPGPIVAAADEDPFAVFNFGNDSNDALMSPTQAFHATMQTPTQDIEQDSMALYRQLPPPSTSSLPPTMPEQTFEDAQGESQADVVPGSQTQETQGIEFNWQTQAPETPAPALNRGPSAPSETPGWEPTQDQGIRSPWPAARQVRRESTLDSVAEGDHQTQSTVRLRISESPLPPLASAPKRGRLSRRKAVAADESENEEQQADGASQDVRQTDAFRKMARRRKEALTAAERAEAAREMKGMLEEQAEESEDEYAGLGGDDFVAPETEQDKEMIDSSHVDVDERALAAHFAERQRQADEAETSRLYKDLTTGALRRKHANAFDLDEDEYDIAVRRRQMRQREEARKRKLLLQDENLAGLAEGKRSKGKDAFLKAIADDDGDDELITLSDGEEDIAAPSAQDDSQSAQCQDSSERQQETTGNKRRLSAENGDSQSQDRPPAKQRRTHPTAASLSRPTSMLQIQESLSFLLDEPHEAPLAGPTALDASSDLDSEDENASDREYDTAGAAELETSVLEADDAAAIAEEHNRFNDGGFAPDTAAMPPPPAPVRAPAGQRRTRAPVVDRLSLRREASSYSGNVGGKASAWAASSMAAKATPSLLRRATTSAMVGNDRGVTTSNSGAGGLRREASAGSGEAGMKKGGSKKSSLAYLARAEERRGIVEAGSRRRREETERMAKLRRQEGARGWGLAGGVGGKFE